MICTDYKNSVSIKLRISSTTYSVDEMIDKLKITPTNVGVMGKKIEYPKAKVKPRFATYYKKHTYRYEIGIRYNLPICIDEIWELINVFKDKKKELRELSKKCDIDIYIGIFAKTRNYPGIFIDKKMISFMRSINAEFDIDLI